MKIPASIRSLYADRRPIYERLQGIVDNRIRGWVDKKWHYESRVKAEESFALKIETGRFEDPAVLEDFFAATIVVPTLNDVQAVIDIVENHFCILARRPRDNQMTHKEPESFPFDDLRLYVALRTDIRFPDTGLEGVRFELQIKTFLQHAWSIATHDLTYKGDGLRWSQQRIAYQIKAMLEHAEISISEANSLARSASLNKSTVTTDKLRVISEFIRKEWGDEAPTDIKRLSENIYEIGSAVEIDFARIQECVLAYIAGNGGSPPLNVSPYSVFVDALLKYEGDKLRRYLASESRRRERKKLVFTEEILSRDDAIATMPRSIFIQRPAS